MLGSFGALYVAKLAIVGVVLAGLYAAARGLRRWRVFPHAAQRRIAIVESAMLSQHAAIHLLRFGKRYLLVGAGSGGISVLAELPTTETEEARSKST